MSQPAGGFGAQGRPSSRAIAERAYATHLMQNSNTLKGLSGMNARLMQNYLQGKMHDAAYHTDRALAEYGHVRDMSNPDTQQVHKGLMEYRFDDQPGRGQPAQRAGSEPLVESVVAAQEGWMADFKTDVKPRVRAYTDKELGQAGAKAVERAEIWVENSQSPELAPEELREFKEAGDLAQLQLVQEQAGGAAEYGAASRPADAPAVASHTPGWVPAGRAHHGPQQGG